MSDRYVTFLGCSPLITLKRWFKDTRSMNFSTRYYFFRANGR